MLPTNVRAQLFKVSESSALIFSSEPALNSLEACKPAIILQYCHVYVNVVMNAFPFDYIQAWPNKIGFPDSQH